jgi:catecholate siderophore receptor
MAYYNTTTLQSDFSKKFQAMGMQHQFLSGIEYLKEESSRKALFDFGNLSTPDFRTFQGANVNATTFDGNSYAVYAQDTVEFIPKWKLTAGARQDQMKAQYSTGTLLDYKEWSYRSALSYHPTDESHYYLGWSDSFSPTADLYQLTGTPQPPERSNVFELGAKYILLDGDLALRAALYRADKVWERNADLEATNAPILTKKRRTDGIELEAAGRITRNWEVFAGISLMDATILEVAPGANPGLAGKRARNTPKYTFNLWTTYKIDEQWKIGGGVEAKGDRQAFNPASANALPLLNGSYHPNTAPAYGRVDTMLAYEQPKWALKFNVKNVLDKLYYDSIYDRGSFTVPGVRRTFILTAELKY